MFSTLREEISINQDGGADATRTDFPASLNSCGKLNDYGAAPRACCMTGSFSGGLPRNENERLWMADRMFRFLSRTKEQTDGAGDQFLLVGLGNPGREYRETRHNAGFMVIDRLAEQTGIGLSRVQSKALIGQGKSGDARIILVKPQTYMNLSGQSVASLLRFYKLPLSQLLVIHDDIDLPFGTIRMRPGGGSGGQKGLASIIQQLGTQEFPRLRVGIGRPAGRMDAADYVLQTFSAAERELLPAVLKTAVEASLAFVKDGLSQAMNQFNGELFRG